MIFSTLLAYSSLSYCASLSSATATAHSSGNSFTFYARSRGSRSTLLSRDAQNNPDTIVNITNDDDLQYLTQVSVGGQNLTLAIDTGSSDLWVHTPQSLTTTNRTEIEVKLTYGIGSAAGDVAFGPTCIGEYCIPEQAFLDANEVEQQHGQGLLGLGLSFLSSIEKAVNTADPTTNALPVIYNIFGQDSSMPRIMSILLERSNDMETTAGGQMTIGEYAPGYTDAEQTLSNFIAPSNSSRWTIAMDQLSINGNQFPMTSSVFGATLNTSIALIDSGTSLAYIPQAAVNFIYGNIPGAIHLQKDSQDVWLVPCLQPANLTLSFMGDTFSINPLELTVLQSVTEHGQQWTICVNSFQPQLAVGSGDLDYLLGDIFMRNVYTVFNYGNISAPDPAEAQASIQFLALTNQTEAFQNFATQRNATLQSRAPLYDIAKLEGVGQWSTHQANSTEAT